MVVGATSWVSGAAVGVSTVTGSAVTVSTTGSTPCLVFDLAFCFESSDFLRNSANLSSLETRGLGAGAFATELVIVGACAGWEGEGVFVWGFVAPPCCFFIRSMASFCFLANSDMPLDDLGSDGVGRV